MTIKKFFLYGLILSCLFFNTNLLASISTKLFQTNKTQNVNQTSLQLHSVAEIPENISISGANNLVISKDGQVGFFSAVKGDYVYAYDLNTGEKLSQIQTGKRASNLSLFDNGKKRFLAVVNLNDSTSNDVIVVSLLDVSNAKKIKLTSAFVLPPALTISAGLTPIFDQLGEKLFIASKNPSSLFVFETNSGRMLEQIPLTSGVSSLSVSHQDNFSLLAAVSNDDAKVTLFEFSQNTNLQEKVSFKLDQNSKLIANNNLCFNRKGTVAYIASAKSSKVFSFDTTSGQMIDSYEVGDEPAQIAVSQHNNKTKIAIVNTGKNHGFLANSVSLIDADNEGHFAGATVFLPALGTNLVADSTVKFNEKGNLGFVGARNQSLFVFDSQTGEQLAESKLLGTATKFALSSDRLVVLTNDADSKRLVVLDTMTNKSLENLNPATLDNKLVNPSAFIQNKTESNPKVNQIKACRVRRTIKVSLLGKGFQPNSQIFINNRLVSTSYFSETRLFAHFSTKVLLGKREFDVIVKNPSNLSSTIFRKQLKCYKH